MKIYLPVVFSMTCFVADVLKRQLFPRYFCLNISRLTLNDLLNLQSLRHSMIKGFCDTFSLRVLELYTILYKRLGTD